MAAWFSVIKVVLPYVAPVVSAALPAFTKKKDATTEALVAQQIGELQEAAKVNGESIHALAKAIEESARINDAAIRRARWMSGIAVAVALISVVIAIVSLTVAWRG